MSRAQASIRCSPSQMSLPMYIRSKISVLFMGLLLIGAGCGQAASTPTDGLLKTASSSGDNMSAAPDAFASAPVPNAPTAPVKETDVVAPLADAGSRVTKKPFGIHVTPKSSPVSPERFSGYHTGTDFETFPEEQDADVSVSAICSGTLLRAGTASGYGGYAVQACVIQGQAVTVVYGHVRASSMTAKIGTTLEAGQVLGFLGKGYSSETDGERKHLHLGIHRGTAVNIRGYVSTQGALADWMDAAVLLKIH